MRVVRRTCVYKNKLKLSTLLKESQDTDNPRHERRSCVDDDEVKFKVSLRDEVGPKIFRRGEVLEVHSLPPFPTQPRQHQPSQPRLDQSRIHTHVVIMVRRPPGSLRIHRLTCLRPTSFATSKNSSASRRSTLALAIPIPRAGSGAPTSSATHTRPLLATGPCYHTLR